MSYSHVILDVLRISWKTGTGQCETGHTRKYFTRLLLKPSNVHNDKCTTIKIKHKLLNDSKYKPNKMTFPGFPNKTIVSSQTNKNDIIVKFKDNLSVTVLYLPNLTCITQPFFKNTQFSNK